MLYIPVMIMYVVHIIIIWGTQWVITDARHDSTANAYHTTVPCHSGKHAVLIPCMSCIVHVQVYYTRVQCTCMYI